MKKILTICPTYNRISILKDMINSFNETIECDNTLVLGISIDDPEFISYKDINVNKIICKAGSTITQIINDIYLIYPDYDFYHVTNDDAIYRTKGWDSKFSYILEEYGHGIVYGNDLFQGKNLCTFPFISREILKSLGWLQMPRLNKYAGDVVWKLIGEQCNCLFYLDHVIIQHKWKGCSDSKLNKEDMQEFAKWLPFSFKDVIKVKEAIKNVDLRS